MNPLDALRLAASPELRPDLLARAGQGAAGGVIPAGELDKLVRAGQGAAGGAISAGELDKLAPQTATGFATAATPASGSFSNVLGQMVQEVNTKQVAAGDAVNGLLTGQNVTLHQAMIAMEEANVSFQLMVQVRNKLLDSYQELMRMQV
jgi:flagellar hook-basal body complex protein FliE